MSTVNRLIAAVVSLFLAVGTTEAAVIASSTQTSPPYTVDITITGSANQLASLSEDGSGYLTVNGLRVEDGATTDILLADVAVINFTGNAGNDTINFSSLSSVAGIGGTLDGGGGKNQLVGTGDTETFVVTGTSAGTYAGTFNFSNFENIGAGGGGDTVIASSANDIFGFAGAGTFTLSGNIVFSGISIANGGDGADTFIRPHFFGSGREVIGGDGADTIDDSTHVAIQTYEITGVNSGLIVEPNILFQEIESITTTSLGSTIEMAPGASLQGTLTGSSSTDLITYFARSSDVTVDFVSGVATDIGAIVSIERARGGWGDDEFYVTSNQTLINGDSVGTDVIHGTSGNDEFTLAGSSSGTFESATDFIGIERVNGGDGDDVFIDAIRFAGVIDGQGGTNTIDDSGDSITRVYDITGPDSGSGTLYDFANVQNLITNSGASTVVVGASGSVSGILTATGTSNQLRFNRSTPVVINANVGTATDVASFNNFNVLYGGTGNDDIHPTSATINVYGNNGTDSLYLSDANEIIAYFSPASGQINSITSFAQMENVYAGDGDDVFQNTFYFNGLSDGQSGTNTIDDSTIAFSSGYHLDSANGGYIAGRGDFANISSINAGPSTDAVYVRDGGSLSGLLDGGIGDENLLYYSTRSTPVTIDGLNQTATDLAGGFVNFHDFAGSTADDIIILGQGGENYNGYIGADIYTWNVDVQTTPPTIYDNNASDQDQFIVNGTTSADDFVTTPGVITVGSQSVSYLFAMDNVQIFLNGHDGDDTFDTRGVNATIVIDGGAPSSRSIRGVPSGDVLNYDAAGGVLTPSNPTAPSGDIKNNNGAEPVFYSDIEVLNIFNAATGLTDWEALQE